MSKQPAEKPRWIGGKTGIPFEARWLLFLTLSGALVSYMIKQAYSVRPLRQDSGANRRLLKEMELKPEPTPDPAKRDAAKD